MTGMTTAGYSEPRVEFAERVSDSAAVEAGYKLAVVEIDLVNVSDVAVVDSLRRSLALFLQRCPVTENRIWSPSAVGSVMSHRLRLFALNGTDKLGRDIGNLLGHPLSAYEEREFEDGEHKARPIDPIGGADVYVIHSLHGGPESDGQWVRSQSTARSAHQNRLPFTRIRAQIGRASCRERV